MRGPTPAVPGTNFPFPQNRHNARCTYPSNYLNSAVRSAYERWKAETVTADGAGDGLRVKRPKTGEQVRWTPDQVCLGRTGDLLADDGLARRREIGMRE